MTLLKVNADFPIINWTYSQGTGILSYKGKLEGKGYSGNTQGLNNPKLEMVHNLGPIPKGVWEIGQWFDDRHLGPCVAALRPTSQDVYGRGGFFIHGDNAKMDHSASDGCIILPRFLRQAIKASKETIIEVTI